MIRENYINAVMQVNCKGEHMSNSTSQYISVENKNEFSQGFWDNVAELKKAKGYSLPKLAERGNIIYATLSSAFWNRQNSAPNLKMLLRLATAFEVAPDFLLRKDIGSEEVCNQGNANGDKPSASAIELSRILRDEAPNLSTKQLDSIYIHALSYFDISKSDLQDSPDDGRKEEKDPDMEKINAISEMLISAMKRKNLTKTQLARLSGVSYTACKNLEAGTSIPDLMITLKLANALGITYPLLFGSMTEKKNDIIRQIRYSEVLIDKNNYPQRISILIPLLSDPELDCLRTHIDLMLQK